MQGFNTLAVLLHQSPCLKGFVGFKSLILGVHQKCDGVPYCIISEGYKIFLALTRWGAGWPPYIGMYFVTEVLGWWTNLDFRDRLPSCVGKYTGIASCFLQTRVVTF